MRIHQALELAAPREPSPLQPFDSFHFRVPSIYYLLRRTLLVIDLLHVSCSAIGAREYVRGRRDKIARTAVRCVGMEAKIYDPTLDPKEQEAELIVAMLTKLFTYPDL